MQRTYLAFIVFLSCLLFNSCKEIREFLYPINAKNTLKDIDEINFHPLNYYIDYENSNLFQLRIVETEESFSEEMFDPNTGEKIKLTSDSFYKKYSQQTQSQKPSSELDPLVVEEKYIYLDKLKDESSNSTHGFCFNFISFPTIDKEPENESSRTKYYYSDYNNLFANVIRSVEVGIWLRKEKKLLFIFNNSNNRVVVYEGLVDDDKIEIIGISHPSRLDKRIEELEEFLFSTEYENIRKDEKLKLEKMGYLFDRIKSRVKFIKLNSVLDLDEKNLIFHKIPSNKKFIIEKRKNDQTFELESFTVGYWKTLKTPSLFLNFKNCNDSLICVFKKKNTGFYYPKHQN